MPRQYCALLVLIITTLAAPDSFAWAPKRGEKISFKRIYTQDHLKNHPLQMVTKTEFTLSNSGGLLTGKWNATIRDIRTDALVEARATGICRASGKNKVECAFDAEAGNMIITREKDGMRLSIPVGHGVRFDKDSADGLVWAELLIGTDDDNNTYKLLPWKKL